MNKIKTTPSIQITQFHDHNLNSHLYISPQKKYSHQITNIQQKKNHIISNSSNWFIKIISLIYLSQTNDLKNQLNNTYQKILKSQIKICCCLPHTIPKYYIDHYNKQFLAQTLKSQIQNIIQIEAEINEKIKQQKFLKLIEQNPFLQFTLNLLVRCMTIDYTKKLLTINSIDYLGNQSDVLKDYSSTPQYKVIGLIGTTFKLDIEIKTIGRVQYIQNYTEQQYNINLRIIKNKNNIEFGFYSKQKIIKKTISTQSSAKDFLKNFFDKSPRENDKSCSKICPKCNQMRKINEKFCSCRKNKLGSNTTIPMKPY